MELSDDIDLSRILSRIRIYGTFRCWIYMGARVSNPRGGYGKAKVRGRVVRVHRWVFEKLIGPAPQLLDHMCRVRSCCHPNHVQESTVKENTKNGLSGLRRHT